MNATTKKIRGTDLSAKHFLYVGCPHPKYWLLPVCDPTSKEKTRALIERNLECWEQITKHIPLEEHRHLRQQLEGAAQSVGIAVPEVTVTEDEMILLLAERAASRVLAEIDALRVACSPRLMRCMSSERIERKFSRHDAGLIHPHGGQNQTQKVHSTA